MRADAAPTGKSFRFVRRARGSSLDGFRISNVAPAAPGPSCARRWLGFGFGFGFGSPPNLLSRLRGYMNNISA